VLSTVLKSDRAIEVERKLGEHDHHFRIAWSEDKIAFTLNGSRIVGRYVMIRFRRIGEREWLLWREEG
jgi:hypothetical protein